MITEKGGMSWTSPNMEMKTSTNGGIGEALGRMFGGEGVFNTRVTGLGNPSVYASQPDGIGTASVYANRKLTYRIK